MNTDKPRKFKIVEIWGWEEDRQLEAGDACHMSDGDILRKRLDEYEEKIENGQWPGIPFVCMAKSEDEALKAYNKEHCDHAYYRATEATFEDRHDFKPMKLRQLMGLADDNTLFRIDREDKRAELNVFNSDFSDNYEEVCELVDPLLDREVASFSVGMSPDPTNEDGDDNQMPTVWVRLQPE